MRLAVLLLILSWIPPLSNCDGSALTDLAGFSLWTERIVKTGEIMNMDGSMTEIAVRTFLTAPLAADVMEATLDDPAVGGMVAYRVSSRDWAGNEDCETERPTP
jgi:hypothetical protein